MPIVLEAKALVKHFAPVKAVDGVSFSIASGCCFGLLGPNGAGKTTTVELLEGLLKPSAGEIYYQGKPLDAQFRNEAGIMFQATALQDFMTTLEALRMFQSFYPTKLPLQTLIERCALSEFLHRDTRKLSGGQRQRVLLAIALVNDPNILFLDEPTTGLDPQARRNFWDLVNTIKQAGKTVVLTTHYMEEAYYLCDQIAIMDHGKIIAQDSPRQLLASHFNEVIVRLPKADVAAVLPALSKQFGANLHSYDEHINILSKEVNQTIAALLALDISLNRMRIREHTLEDLFLALTGHELRA